MNFYFFDKKEYKPKWADFFGALLMAVFVFCFIWLVSIIEVIFLGILAIANFAYSNCN